MEWWLSPSPNISAICPQGLNFMKAKLDYEEILKLQFTNAKEDPTKSYLEDLYLEIVKRISPSAFILEVGAGAGTSTLFLPNHNILRTDLISANPVLVSENVNVLDLGFKSGEFDAVIAIDVIHHLSDPLRGLSQMCRVIKPNGKILLIEPYVSIFSFPIYKVFHQEKTSMFLRQRDLLQSETKEPSLGNQTIAQTVFKRKSLTTKLKDILGPGAEISITYRDFIGFFATGGINKPLRTSGSFIRLVLKLEKNIPQSILKLIASRMIIEINFDTREYTD